MVTGRYPFRQPEDERQRPAQRLHAMLQRILSVTYSFPPDLTLSEALRDVISKMLVAGEGRCPPLALLLWRGLLAVPGAGTRRWWGKFKSLYRGPGLGELAMSCPACDPQRSGVPASLFQLRVEPGGGD